MSVQKCLKRSPKRPTVHETLVEAETSNLCRSGYPLQIQFGELAGSTTFYRQCSQGATLAIMIQGSLKRKIRNSFKEESCAKGMTTGPAAQASSVGKSVALSSYWKRGPGGCTSTLPRGIYTVVCFTSRGSRSARTHTGEFFKFNWYIRMHLLQLVQLPCTV